MLRPAGRGLCAQPARFHHHPLLAGAGGRKLSKSDGALSLAAMRENGAAPVAVYREAARLLDLDTKMIGSLADLLAGYQAESGT